MDQRNLGDGGAGNGERGSGIASRTEAWECSRESAVVRARRSGPFVAGLAVLAVVLPFQLAPPSSVAAAASSMRARETREVQTIWTAEFSEPHPTGLAYLPGRR